MNRPTPIIDTHCHLYYDDFKPDWDEMLRRAEEAGVSGMIAVGADAPSSRQAVEIAKSYPHIYCTVGIHPHDAQGVDEATIVSLAQLARNTPKCVAIGEIGLDFFRDRSPRDEQKRLFRRFLQVACELDKPVVIHGVRSLFHSPEVLEGWPAGDPRTTRLVFIVKDEIDRAMIEDGIRSFEEAARRDVRLHVG
jgi:TatD family hydrolase